MEELNFSWNAEIGESAKLETDGKSLFIKGVLLDLSVNRNGWAVPEDELANIASQVQNGVPLQLDHSSSIKDNVGGTTLGEVDTENKRVIFGAEVDDPATIRKILKKRVKTVSIRAGAQAMCSVCNKPALPSKTCKCEGSHIIVRKSKVKEVSLINEPAYEKAEFVPVSFVASVEDALKSSLQSSKPKVEEILEINKIKEEVKVTQNEKTETAKTETIVAQVDPKLMDAFANLGTKLEECVGLMKKKTEEEDEAKKKAEDEKVKKESTTKMEETIRAIVKEELAKVPKEEKKKQVPPEDEEEEEEKPAEKKKETVGAKVETVETINAKAKTSTDPWSGAWGELKAEAKRTGVIV